MNALESLAGIHSLYQLIFGLAFLAVQVYQIRTARGALEQTLTRSLQAHRDAVELALSRQLEAHRNELKKDH